MIRANNVSNARYVELTDTSLSAKLNPQQKSDRPPARDSDHPQSTYTTLMSLSLEKNRKYALKSLLGKELSLLRGSESDRREIGFS